MSLNIFFAGYMKLEFGRCTASLVKPLNGASKYNRFAPANSVIGDYNLTALDYVPKCGLHWVGNCNELNAGMFGQLSNSQQGWTY